jgi:putative transposase
MKRRSVKVRIYPNKKQEELLSKCFGCDRFIYNRSLKLRKERYESYKQNTSWVELCWNVTFLKRTEEYQWLNEVPRCILDQAVIKLDKAYQGFFKLGRGYPKFKKKFDNQSFTVSNKTKIKDNKIKLPKLEEMHIKGLRKFEGSIKNVTVIKNKSGQYFASWSVEDVKDIGTTTGQNTVGIDVNLENFLTDSNGNRVENPRFKQKVISKIKHYQRKVNKSTKGSNNRNKYRLKLAKEYQKITNKKQDFLHKLSLSYVKNHDIIKVEDLKITNMIKNHNLAESISNVSWGEFFRQLEYKSSWYGKTFIRVDPKNTSRTCNSCGIINKKLKLKDRKWKCVCGVEHIRDENASKNIKDKGIVLKISGDIRKKSKKLIETKVNSR